MRVLMNCAEPYLFIKTPSLSSNTERLLEVFRRLLVLCVFACARAREFVWPK